MNEQISQDNQILLTIMCHGRNDNYHDGFLYRLATSLNALGRNIEILDAAAKVEILLLDWGSDQPLFADLILNPAARKAVRFINCPPDIAKKYDQDGTYSHVHVVNTLARRARGKYLLLSDADSFIPLETFAQLLFHLRQGYVGPHSLQRTFFWGSRWHVPVDFVRSMPTFEQLEQHIRRNWTTYATDQMSRKNFQCAASVLLISKDMYAESTGLWEKLIYWGWQDIEFHRRLCRRYSWDDLECFGMRFFHLEHYLDRTNTPVNANRKVNARENPAHFAANGADWGLASETLPMVDANGKILNADHEMNAPQLFNQLESPETLNVSQILAQSNFRQQDLKLDLVQDSSADLAELASNISSFGTLSVCVLGDHFDRYTSFYSNLPNVEMLISLNHWESSRLELEVLKSLPSSWRAYLYQNYLMKVAENGSAEKVFPLQMELEMGIKAFREGQIKFGQVFFSESVYIEELAWLIHAFAPFASVLSGVMPKDGAKISEVFYKVSQNFPVPVPEAQWRLVQGEGYWMVIDEAVVKPI